MMEWLLLSNMQFLTNTYFFNTKLAIYYHLHFLHFAQTAYLSLFFPIMVYTLNKLIISHCAMGIPTDYSIYIHVNCGCVSNVW